MPLSLPSDNRVAQHIRAVTYRSFMREDGLWDIEAELIDTKAVDFVRSSSQAIHKAGMPIHHMLIRTTVDEQLQVHAIEAVMEAHPLQGCPGALDAMQQMVGCSMRKGWRKSIDANLAGVAGCTHLRELLFNMATAAFQSVGSSAFATQPDLPPRYLGRCTGWDFNGAGVAQYFPKFVGWAIPVGKSEPEPLVSESK